jgi:hypothetical protein
VRDGHDDDQIHPAFSDQAVRRQMNVPRFRPGPHGRERPLSRVHVQDGIPFLRPLRVAGRQIYEYPPLVVQLAGVHLLDRDDGRRFFFPPNTASLPFIPSAPFSPGDDKKPRFSSTEKRGCLKTFRSEKPSWLQNERFKTSWLLQTILFQDAWPSGCRYGSFVMQFEYSIPELPCRFRKFLFFYFGCRY